MGSFIVSNQLETIGQGNYSVLGFGSAKWQDTNFKGRHLIRVATECMSPGGGIGRRAWFRSMCLRVWRFESSLGHQVLVTLI